MTDKKKIAANEGRKSLSELLDEVHVGDAREITTWLPDNSVNVTITSPPYFDLKDYDRPNQIGFGQDYEGYLDDLALVFSEVYRATKKNGSLWIIVDTFRKGQVVYPLPFDIARRLKGLGWVLRDIVIWKKERTVPWVRNGATRKIFEYILVLSKSVDQFKYDLDKYRDRDDLKRWWVRYPERYNPRGKAPEEIWSYDIPTQGSWGDSYIRHFCPLPSDLVARIVQLTTTKNGVVFDPFSGSGTVPTVSKLLGRSYIGSELNAKYVKMFKKHLAQELATQGQRRLRSPHSRSVADFESTIGALRILKFGRLILRTLLAEYPDAGIQVYVFELPTKPTENFKHYSAEYVVYLPMARQRKEAMKLTETAIKKPPLSKFGVQPTFTFIESANEISPVRRKLIYFTYSRTNSHFQTGEVSFKTAWDSEDYLFSPIKLEVEEPHG
ncbi:MAG: methylase domain protein [Ramlibacter sp.]|nr:methylase domain protein [Ramlibacter sp.]